MVIGQVVTRTTLSYWNGGLSRVPNGANITGSLKVSRSI